jgi:hypothetical protein
MVVSNIIQQRRKSDVKSANHWGVNLFVYSAFIIILGFMVTIGIWYWWPYDVVNLSNIKLAKSVVFQGETVTYSDTIDKKMSINGVSARHFVDGIIFDAGETPADAPVGRGKVVKELKIPETLPTGVYKLQIVMRFQVNPIRTVEYTFYSSEFKVLPASHADASQDASQDKDKTLK